MSAAVQAQTTTATPAGAAPGGPRPDGLRASAQEFEAVFLAQLLAQINPPQAGDGQVGSGDQNLFHQMFNEEMAKLISRSGGVGVADAVLKEMLKSQEMA